MMRSRNTSTSSQSPISSPLGEFFLITTGFHTPSTGSPMSRAPGSGIEGA